MAVATHSDRSASARDNRGDSNLALVSQHADLSGSTLMNKSDNAIYAQAKTHADMAELSQKHNFPPSDQLLPLAQSTGDASTASPHYSKTDASPHPAGGDGQIGSSPAPRAAAQGNNETAPPKVEGGSHEVYDVHVQSTIGNDTKVAVDVPPTSVPAEAPTTGTTSPIENVDSRPAVDHTPAHQHFDATPPAYAQNDQNRFTPPARTDNSIG